MWAQFFIFGDTWFWILTTLEIMALFVSVENDYDTFAFFSVVVFLLLIHLFGNATLFSYIKDNPLEFLKWAGCYIVVGFLWAIANLYFKTAKVRRKINEVRERFNRSTNIKNESTWRDYLRNELTENERRSLDFSSYHGRIISWMAYFPVSMIWTLINDPFKRLAIFIYESFLVGAFRWVHKKVLGRAYEI